MTFLVTDGVVPSNEERGYVLRRIIRRAVRHAYRLGARDLVTPALVDATVEVMGGAYPELEAHHELVTQRDPARGGAVPRHAPARARTCSTRCSTAGDVTGERAFFLHDTLGFPLELTREIAAERGLAVDVDGLRGRRWPSSAPAPARRTRPTGGAAAAPVELYREILDEHGPTEFTGREEYATDGAKVLAHRRGGRARRRGPDDGDEVDVFLDRTPFYAESGGQVGDTGTITRRGRRDRRTVLDTQYAIPARAHACTAAGSSRAS